ncbi:hypothetical protein SASPL_113448 [Salvia splendens]|uniref:Myb/SANT-like domain-containing protein n=1 Tax=Salvia splendens TaxID=180675 RepID=A0A8X8Y1N7_SALSN|nr:hypothetical protein SASPL_155872 [Salvia splendens]KAG6384852.1 hypothetical protein SASPL_153671 [Salvia splendens]KAG6384978.1 hypothetical protein SASPL_153801 [Salvia splendens]KAG6385014.1 hypothetical protein SASPL_153838 [Salvia splendens]KAG6390223.1 hypothetical protein SASPL_147955 [Salvia splendens]
MAMDSPLQSSFLYRGTWKHEIDTIILSTMARLKKDYGCEGSVFPSHFIFEAQSVVEYHFGVTFEWWEIVDRLHFLEQRYRTFKELLGIAGTYWDQPSNKIIVSANTWASHLPRNHLFGAYHSSGDPAYKELRELFAVNESMQGIERTLIVLSDSVEAAGHLCDAPKKNAQPVEPGEVNSGNPFSLARRKLMFDDGGPQDLESTNKNVTGRVLPRETPSRSPTLTYSCGSSKPVTWYRMPRKPDI